MRFRQRCLSGVSALSLLGLVQGAVAQPTPGSGSPAPEPAPPASSAPVPPPPVTAAPPPSQPAAAPPAAAEPPGPRVDRSEAPVEIDIPQVTVEGREPRRPARPAPGEAPARSAARRPAAPSPAPVPRTTVAPPTQAPASSGTPPAPSLGNASAADLQRDTSGNFGASFLTRPGATAAGLATQSARPILRGLSDAKVRIQENGVGTTDVSDIAQDHAVPIDPLSVQRTTVIRGPGALKFGSQAVGGVVEATNNRIPTAAPPGGVSVESKAGGTTGNNGWETGLLLDAGSRDVAVHADVYGRQGADYRIPRYPYLVPPAGGPAYRGRQPNSSFSAEGAAVGASYLFESGYAGLAISRFTSDYYVPGIATAADRQHNDLQQTKVTSKGEISPDLPLIGTIRYWLGHSEYRHDETLRTRFGSQTIGATFRNTQEEGRLEAELRPIATPFGILTTTIGGQGVSQKLNTKGQAILQPALTQTGAGYVFAETRHTDTFRTQLAGRIESVTVGGTGFVFPSTFLPPPDDPTSARAEKRYTPKSISFGAIQDLPFFTVASLTAQRIERAPRPLELFASGPDGSEKTFKIGNSDLKIETASTIEGGLSRTGGDFRFDAKAYYTRYENFIYGRTTGNFCQETFASCGAGTSTDYIQVNYAQRNAVFRGAELSWQWLLLPLAGGTFGIDGQFDVVRATFDDGSNVPRIPPMRIGGGAFWRDGEWSARLSLIHAYPQNDYSQFDTRTPGYDVLKLELERTALWRTSPLGPIEVTTGLVADNLLDAPIRNAVQFHKDEILLPGRTFKGYLNVKYASLDALKLTRRRWALLDPDREPADEAERFDWSGAYAGLHAGYRGRSVTTDTSLADAASGDDLGGGRRTARSGSPVGGGQAGYNWVLGPWLAGLEADVQSSGSDRRLTRSCAAGGCRIPPGTLGAAVTSGLDHGLFGTIRGRAGLLLTPDILTYVTAGVPIGAVTKAGTATIPDLAGRPLTGSFANSPIKVGWSVGAGIETRLIGDWTARLEYLHHDFGSSATIPLASAASPVAVGYASHLREDVVRVGLNTRFDVGWLAGR